MGLRPVVGSDGGGNSGDGDSVDRGVGGADGGNADVAGNTMSTSDFGGGF